MKYISSMIILFLLSYSTSAQDNYNYIQSTEDIKGNRTVFTEIDIAASPEMVKKKFLAFDNWSEWCKVIPQIRVLSGDIYNLETQPKLDLILDFGRKKDPQKAPINPSVTVNNKEVFVWGIYNGFILKAEDVFVFQAINGGKETHLIHYEKMAGLLSPFFLTKKVNENMAKHYKIMNHDLKNICEK